MSRSLHVGAVAYDPKVVSIWEGLARYLRSEGRLPVDVALFLSYPAQVDALLEGRIDLAWNTNLAYLQSETWSQGACRPVCMRDTDLGWTSKIFAPQGGPVRTLSDLRGRTLALGSSDSGHAAILPTHFLAREGLRERREYQSIRFDPDLGKHGDTGTSELEVLKAVMDGRADAGVVGSPFWTRVASQELVPPGSLLEVWTSPSFSHCMFTARPGLEPDRIRSFAEALEAMSFDNPEHRKILEAEGLRSWVPPHTEGYDDPRTAATEQSFFVRPTR
ncbi:MAG: PhnD/SsuA/transferrin family substrate-binding protein [Thermoplasmata archaeon]|nr:PhnD/SsuA/transferrin family substrate-binding protein [Thermoplasmata archaeon]